MDIPVKLPDAREMIEPLYPVAWKALTQGGQ